MAAFVTVALIMTLSVIVGVVLTYMTVTAAEKIARHRRLRRLPPDIYAPQTEIEAFMDQPGASMDKSSVAPK